MLFRSSVTQTGLIPAISTFAKRSPFAFTGDTSLAPPPQRNALKIACLDLFWAREQVRQGQRASSVLLYYGYIRTVCEPKELQVRRCRLA